MQIRKQGKNLQLIRYYSVKEEGKQTQKQSLIATLSLDIDTEKLSALVVNKLTPPEFEQLQKYLSRLEGDRLVSQLEGLGAVINQANRLIMATADAELKTQLQKKLAALAGKLETVPAQSAGKTV
jgi:hypothetical protein